MAKHQSEPARPAAPPDPKAGAGDNRRAGDTDGNASGGATKSRGATNPAEEPPAQIEEDTDES